MAKKERDRRIHRNAIVLRCTDAQHAALKRFVEKINEDRKSKGKKEIALSTWIREFVLLETGNARLSEDEYLKTILALTKKS